MSIFRRLTLRNSSGEKYLQRWGLQWDLVGRIYLHHIVSPDPGFDLHDHPWTAVSIILNGGYKELRAPTNVACQQARECDIFPLLAGDLCRRKRFSVRVMRRTECHTIVEVEPFTWTLLIGGPRRRLWGFYTPDGWVPHYRYDTTRRPLQEER